MTKDMEQQLNYLVALVNDHLALLPESSRVAVRSTVAPVIENVVFTIKSLSEENEVLRSEVERLTPKPDESGDKH